MINPDEIGCQVNMVTGGHYGPCRGTCKIEEKSPWTSSERAVGRFRKMENGHYATFPYEYYWMVMRHDGSEFFNILQRQEPEEDKELAHKVATALNLLEGM